MGMTLTLYMSANVLDSRPVGDGILTEDGDFITTEDGDYIVDEG